MNAYFDLHFPQENEAVGCAIQVLPVVTDLVSNEWSKNQSLK